MIRILVVDDETTTAFLSRIRFEVAVGAGEEEDIEIFPLNPNELQGPEPTLDMLLSSVKQQAEEFVDVVVIDMNLGEIGHLTADERTLLPITIARVVREVNSAATVIVYSGTLNEHIKEIFKVQPNERPLKDLVHSAIHSFVPRSRIYSELVSALLNPSWLLRLDRLLSLHGDVVVSPDEAEFRGVSFRELARDVRAQTDRGRRVAQKLADHGVACFLDINS